MGYALFTIITAPEPVDKMAFDFSSFVNEYFIYPMRYPNAYPPYNIYNTAAFAATALVAAYFLHRILTKKLKLAVDGDFYFAIIPFLLFAGVFRVLEDAKVLPREIIVGGISFFPFITPGIYFVVFLLAVFSFVLSYYYSRKSGKSMFKSMGMSGAVLSIIAFSVLISRWSFPNLFLGVGIVFLAMLSAYMFRLADRLVFKSHPSKIELCTVFGQCLDGAATFGGIAFAGYGEQHVVGNFIIDSFGPLAFFLVKAAFAFAVIWIARREFTKSKKDQEAKTYLLLLITTFGLAPGTRDLLRIVMGV